MSRWSVAVLLACAVAGLAAQGCIYNPSPIHNDLTLGEMRTRVAQRFQVGMPRAEVERQLRKADLSSFSYQEPGRWTGAGERSNEGCLVASTRDAGVVWLFGLPATGVLECWLNEQQELTAVWWGWPMEKRALLP